MRRTDSLLALWSPRLLSVLRAAAAFLFMSHGMQKVLGLPVPRATPVELLSLSGIAGVMELAGGVLLLIGLFTRPVAFLLSGELAEATFYANARQGFWQLINRGAMCAR